MPQDWKQLITSNPEICRGARCVTGTRIPVTVVLDNLAAGKSPEAIMGEYPALTVESVRACLAYAAELAHRVR